MIHEIIDGIRIPIPQNYKDCCLLIKSDAYRIWGQIIPVWKIYLFSFYEPTIRFLFWHRLTQYRGNHFNLFYYYAKWRHRHYLFKYGLMIASSTKIGYGFYIGHPFGIIINHTAVIGNNVNISQFTTIGSNEGKAAVIGDNVYIGPNCCLVENVHIGANASIGAGAVVTKDIAANAVAVGVPAKEIDSTLKPGCFITHRWPVEAY